MKNYIALLVFALILWSCGGGPATPNSETGNAANGSTNNTADAGTPPSTVDACTGEQPPQEFMNQELAAAKEEFMNQDEELKVDGKIKGNFLTADKESHLVWSNTHYEGGGASLREFFVMTCDGGAWKTAWKGSFSSYEPPKLIDFNGDGIQEMIFNESAGNQGISIDVESLISATAGGEGCLFSVEGEDYGGVAEEDAEELGGGISNEVEYIDQDGDGIMEIVVTTTSDEGTVTISHKYDPANKKFAPQAN